MLYIIGLGLSDERDITVKGLEAVRSCERVYLEAYTSILMVDKPRLEAFYGKPVTVAHRETVESDSDEILRDADSVNVAFLVVGDPYGATTHTDLVLRARERNIPVTTIHNASIMNAVGATGLQLYNFGQTVSIVFFTDSWRPDSFYERVAENAALGLHTLCLLDIKVREQSIENLMRGRPVYEPPRYMSVSLAAEQLIEVEASRQGNVCGADALAVGVARVGSDDQLIRAGTLRQLAAHDFGAPLHSLVLVGHRLHLLEAEILRTHAIDLDSLNRTLKDKYKLEPFQSALGRFAAHQPRGVATRRFPPLQRRWYAQRLGADDSVLTSEWKQLLLSWKTLGLIAIPITAFALGTWQVYRLKWKLALLDDVNDRMHRRPIPLPLHVTADEIARNEYRRVLVHGVFDHAAEMLVGPRAMEGEPGFIVVTPLVREDGSRVLVNRGWIRRDLKDPRARPASQPAEPVTLVVFVRRAPRDNAFTPKSDPLSNEWYSIDVPRMAARSRSQE
ncbi:diphthine synthase, partial [Coemansia sp. RSA 2611]